MGLTQGPFVEVTEDVRWINPYLIMRLQYLYLITWVLSKSLSSHWRVSGYKVARLYIDTFSKETSGNLASIGRVSGYI